MKKLNTSPISGMQELLPQEQAVFNKYKETIREVYRKHGFLEIETPTIDRAEILFAKAGGETEKQIYKVIKTDESADDADQALRFDHTVPLARYVAEHESALAFPFRVTQIGRNFRGERAQKGRFREFYQLDVDIVGRNSLAIENDAEVILTLADALEKLNLPPRLIRVSNRKILAGFLEELNLQEVAKEITSIIDHSEKVEPEKVRTWLSELNIGDERVAQVLDFIEISGDADAVVAKLKSFGFENEKFNEGVKELELVLRTLQGQGLYDSVIGDMKIVRGLDYYTGTVFETIIPSKKELGSICSGGRYENLAELYSDQKFPGVGGSIGLTRLFFLMREFGLVEENSGRPVDYAIIPFDSSEREYCFKFAERVREKGFSVDIVWSEKKLGDKLKYAASVAKYGIVLGENEISSGQFVAKDFETGEQTPFSLN
ncbi:histidine--tRNA ligase [Candidatus Saccharibacteria bacterium]|nr:histidine--tRNA ligase [Candidatus Saccharibacteria bacterium]